MSSPELYDRIHASNIGRLRSGSVEVDAFLSSGKPDPRLGLSLVVPIGGIAEPYRALVRSLSRIEPGQYYYPLDDLHITVFDFLQARADYAKAPALVEAFLDISREALASERGFAVGLRGIVFSASAGMIKGYDGGALTRIRKRIRSLMRLRGLANDERYESESAHVTFTRFRVGLADPAALCASIDEFSELEMGEAAVTRLELVEHDWYNSAGTRRIIGEIPLEAP